MVGLGGQNTNPCGDLCPVEVAHHFPGKSLDSETNTEKDGFGFVDVKLEIRKYHVKESVSRINLSDDNCYSDYWRSESNLATADIVLNTGPIRNSHNARRPQPNQKQPVCRRTMLTVQSEKTEQDKRLELWIEKQIHMEEKKNGDTEK